MRRDRGGARFDGSDQGAVVALNESVHIIFVLCHGEVQEGRAARGEALAAASSSLSHKERKKREPDSVTV